MSKGRRNNGQTTRIRFGFLKSESLKLKLFDGESIDWSQFVDRKFVVDSTGNVILGRLPRRGDTALLINNRGSVKLSYFPLKNEKINKKLFIVGLTKWQSKVLTIILDKLEEHGFIRKMEFPNRESVERALAETSFPRSEGL